MRTTTKPDATMPVYIHSTFREYQAKMMKPFGHHWGMNGDSQVLFVIPSKEHGDDHALSLEGNPQLYRGIVKAYNQWCCAKDIRSFVKEEDSQSIEWANDNDDDDEQRKTKTHIHVQWDKERLGRPLPTTLIATQRDKALLRLLEQDEAVTGTGSPAGVWINGDYICELDGSKVNLDAMKMALAKMPSKAQNNNWKLHSSDDGNGGFIRIERFYHSGIQQRPEVFDHVWDNLVALTDPEILDDRTIIGMATLSDWIMGGNLTSPLWIRDEGDIILFLRPLRNDNVDSSDRRYQLSTDDDDDDENNNKTTKQTIAMVRGELNRL
jgi:hypothetical protein